LTGSEEVLDVGFGGGVGLALVLRRLTSGRATGIDISDEMVSAAGRRFTEDVRAGRLRVVRGDVAAIPFADASFDRVYSVNTVFFWPDPATGMAEIHRALRPGGVAVIAGPVSAFVLARAARLAPRAGVRGPQQLRSIARQAGFRDVRLQRRAGAALVTARR
jgi:ubiquinone/menaquinone biosynthesis C-methylase UbiE